jgi:hypothetical protein
MANDRPEPCIATRSASQLGLILTALCPVQALYVAASLGWTAFWRLPLGDLGDFLDGAFAPLAFLWLVLGLFLQQRELAANNLAIQRQFEIMQRTAAHAEIQTRAIAANELHARQDTFIEVTQMVMNQLEVIAGMLFISSQGTIGDGVVSDEEVDLMFARLSSGEASVFSRRMILLQCGWLSAGRLGLFYGRRSAAALRELHPQLRAIVAQRRGMRSRRHDRRCAARHQAGLRVMQCRDTPPGRCAANDLLTATSKARVALPRPAAQPAPRRTPPAAA